MLSGGTIALLLLTKTLVLPEQLALIGLDASLYGILASLFFYMAFSLIFPDSNGTQSD